MPAPWEKYSQTTQTSEGPWAKYQSAPAADTPMSGLDSAAETISGMMAPSARAADAVTRASSRFMFGSEKPGEYFLKGMGALGTGLQKAEEFVASNTAKYGSQLANKLGAPQGVSDAIPYVSAALPMAAEYLGSMAIPGLKPISMPGKTALKNAAQESGYKALGYTKAALNKPGAIEKAKQVAQTMLNEGVIKGPAGTASMLERAQLLKETAGQRMGDSINTLKNAGKKSFSGAEVIDEVKNQLTPRYTGGAYQAEQNVLNEIVDTIKAHGEGQLDFDSAQMLKEKLQEMGRFNSMTDAVKANLYRRASGVVREALDKSVDAATKAGTEMSTVGDTYIVNKDLYGKTVQAEKALTNRLASQQGNKDIGLTDTILAAGQIATGGGTGLAKAAASVGIKKLLEQYYHSTKATSANWLSKSVLPKIKAGPNIQKATMATLINTYVQNKNKGRNEQR